MGGRLRFGRRRIAASTKGVATLEVRVLGGFAVSRDGEELPVTAFGGELVRRLVRILLTRRGEVVSRDVLVDALWPGHPPSDPAANLNVLVSRARKALARPELIRTAPGGYECSPDESCRVDAEVFGERVRSAEAAAQRGDAREALALYLEALEEWTGEPFLEDAYADWAQPVRTRLLRTHQQAIEGAAEAAIAVGDGARAVRLAERAVSGDPMREPAHLLLVRALAAGGDRAGALEAHARLRRRFQEELGLGPSAEAREVEEWILRGEPVSPVRRGRSVPAPRRGRMIFAGRRAELDALLALPDHPPPCVAIVAGRSGAGKTRLLDELVSRVDIPAIAVRAVAAERDEPWSLARSVVREVLGLDPNAIAGVPKRALTVLAALVPELADELDRDRGPVEPDTRRALLLEGSVRLLESVSHAGLLLAADDLQWADPSSLELVARLVGRVDGLALVSAYRPEEVGPDHPLAELLADIHGSASPLVLSLGPLDRASIGDLVADPELVEILVRETDGSPFAVTEVLRFLRDEHAVEEDATGRWTPCGAHAVRAAARVARTGQRLAVAWRARRQPAARRELLGLLALLGREGPARILAEAAERDEEEALADLGALARADLVRFGATGWAPAHDLIGETIAEDLEDAQRLRLHRALADGLRRAGDDPAEIGRHLMGAGLPRPAAEAFLDAVEGRLAHHAGREAEELADAGVALGPDGALRARLLGARAEARSRRGDLPGARDDLRAAVRLLDPGPERARLLVRQALLASGADDLRHASELAEVALVEAGHDPAARARALSVAAVVDMNLHRAERAQERRSEALSLFESLGDSHGVADILDVRAMAVFLDGQIAGGVEAFERAARLLADAGDLLRVVTPRSTRGHALVFAGRPADGLADTREAFEIADQLGHPEGRTYALWHTSEALTALGRVDDALSAASEALVVAEELGHRGWTATALRALGIAREAAGDPTGAVDAYGRSLDMSAHLPLFASWAASRLALVRIAAGDVEGAEPLVERALAEGPPLAGYEARLARAELAWARREPDADGLTLGVIRRAEVGGHLASAAVLRGRITGRPIGPHGADRARWGYLGSSGA